MAFNSHNAAEDNDAKKKLFIPREQRQYSHRPQSDEQMEKFFHQIYLKKKKMERKMGAMRLFPITAITSC